MNKIYLVLLMTFVVTFFGFSNQISNVSKETTTVSFVNLFDNYQVDLMAKKGGSEAKSGYEGFVKKISKHEKLFFNLAIAFTIVFGVLFLTGITLIAVGNAIYYGSKNLADLLTGSYVYYAGYSLFGITWLFAIAAAVFWAFWGMIQHGKKKGYVLAPFVEGESLGLSIKF